MVIFSFVTDIPAAQAIRKGLIEVKEKGTDVGACAGWGPKDLFQIVGLKEIEEIDTRAGGGLYENGL
jgi:hypothetical protein